MKVSDCLCAPLRNGSFDAVLSIAAWPLYFPSLPTAQSRPANYLQEICGRSISAEVLHHLSTEPRRVQAGKKYAESICAFVSAPSRLARLCEKPRRWSQSPVKRLWGLGVSSRFFCCVLHEVALQCLAPRRLLRPGGQLLVYCWSYEPGARIRRLRAHLALAMKPQAGRPAIAVTAPVPSPGSATCRSVAARL